MNVPFEELVQTIAQARAPETANAAQHWRGIERALIAFFESCGCHISNAAGEPFVEIVRWREPDEVVTAKCSLERLAKLLVDEIGR